MSERTIRSLEQKFAAGQLRNAGKRFSEIATSFNEAADKVAAVKPVLSAAPATAIVAGAVTQAVWLIANMNLGALVEHAARVDVAPAEEEL